jgi:hypothetical protein
MKRNTTSIFRIVYIIGLIMLFFSLFLEWYSFKTVDFGNSLLVSWSYYLFTSWQTPISSASALNMLIKPENILIPLIINIILIIVLFAAGYVVLFKNIDRATLVTSYNKYAYINIFLILLIGYYIIVCPVLYLFPQELYFPLLFIRDYDLEYIYIYSIGPGYIMQLISFPLIFPYSVFYYKTTSSFTQQEKSPEKLLQNVISNSQEVLDLDKYIAEEELHQKTHIKVPEENINEILTTFMEEKHK